MRHDGLLRDAAGAIMRGNADPAFRILNGGSPADELGGNKTRSFFEQMSTGGKGDVATIDTWMVAALSGREVTNSGGPKERDKIDTHVLAAGGTHGAARLAAGWSPQATVYSLFDDTVHDLAVEHNMPVADTQAAIWTQMRDHGFVAAKGLTQLRSREPVEWKKLTASQSFVYDSTVPDPEPSLEGDPDDTYAVELAAVNAKMRPALGFK